MKSTPRHKRNPHYRLDFIYEDTFNRLWSIRMTRWRVVLASAAALAAISALIFVIMAYTPLRHYLPGALRGDLRSGYIETTLKLDSLEADIQTQRLWLDNLSVILRDSIAEAEVEGDVGAQATDSLLMASEAERDFLRRYEEQERFSLSVLSPLAAEGMVFASPVENSARMRLLPSGALSVDAARIVPLNSIYRGSVVGVYVSENGRSTVVIQHPNDFISIYEGVGDTYVRHGDRVATGQRIAQTHSREPMTFELWHGGTLLDPREYIPF